MIVNDETPYLVAVLKSSIECKLRYIFDYSFGLKLLLNYIVEDEPIYTMPDLLRVRSPSVISLSGTKRRNNRSISSWSIERKLVIHINIAQRIFNSEGSKVAVMCGLFHGGDSLCDYQTSTPVTPNEMGEGLWEEDICLNIKICDIARMARLCFSIVAIGQNSKKGVKLKMKQMPIAWANTNIFDFKNILKTGSITLSMWNYEQEVEDSELELFNPLGTVVPNPSVDQATCLTITFNKYSEGEVQIAYPSINDISRDSYFGKTLNDTQEEEKPNEESSSKRSRHASKQFLEQLKEICDRDLLHKMTDQERELLWFLREDCRTLLPHSLNKLLISFKWNNHKTVAEVLVLLQEWPKVTPEKALELLDYAYADSMVRTFAIECLKGIFELNDHFL